MKNLSVLPHRALLLCALLPFLFSACTKENVTETGPEVNKSAVLKGSASAVKTGPVNVCYVEANNYPLANVGKYKLANSGANVFDIGIIFAANINYNTSTQKAVLYFNPQVTTALQNSASIQALHAKGIKVLLSVLGNHQGAGVSNFPSQAAAADFAQQCADAVNTYGLDV